MVQAVEAGIENGISKLSAIHQLIDQVNNLTPMKMSDGCKADEGGTKEPLTLYELVTNSMQSIPPETLLPLVKDIVQDLARYHQKGETYNNLHPKNVVLIDGSAKLLPLKAAVAANSLKETSCSKSEVQQDDIVTFADNIYSVGMLILWLSVQGNGNFESAEEVKLHIMPSIPKLLAEKPGDRPTIQEVEQLWFSNSDQTSLQENQMKRQNVFPGKIEEDTPVGTVEKTSSDSALSDDLIVQHKTSATKEKYTESSDTVGFEMDEKFVLAMQIKAENVGITENEDLVSMQITENEGLVSAMQGSVDITENEDLDSMQITENEGLVSAISGAGKSVD
ncbi:uncharacterized protein LOC121878815 [Homarus americanus]|uniref:uncharacterized protein LOC121878815 n=1 Tax=Homarus americanus TaxID=6706 RepID=UPI001C465919|nr:uncharacterized protein LOC121878815 [Homarus americanus]